MTANTSPIYPLTPNNGAMNVVLTSANTAKDGTGTAELIFTAGANGSRIKRIVIKPIGTNVQTCLRIFINNGSSQSSASNNLFYGDYTILANTLSETAATNDYVYPMELDLAAGYKVYVTIGTAVSAGLAISAHGGDY